MSTILSPRNVTAVALAVAAVAAAAPAAGAATPKAGPDLYVATTAGGKLTKVEGKGRYKLTLKDPANTVSAFADRPERTASTVSLSRFVQDWGANGFAADAPNAALVLDQAPAAHDVYTFELGTPRIKPDGDVVLRVKRVGARPAGALEPIVKRADKGTPRGFGRASLFIDDGATQTPLMIQADLPVNTNALLLFNDPLSLQPNGSFGPYVVSEGGSGSVNMDPTSVTLQSGAGGAATETQIAVAHTGTGPVTGVAQLPAGGTLTIKVNGTTYTIGNGAFSLPL
jgi:hypothetical protein